ncbi:MAG: hypothetical protein HZA90_13805 [Verrucomicrobia bacterium]|nr:hypothetical protein [Verrucomicrobiota bacterium]
MRSGRATRGKPRSAALGSLLLLCGAALASAATPSTGLDLFALSNSPARLAAAMNAPGPLAANHVFTWQDVLRREYTNYLAKLRGAGCPEVRVRQIVVSDVLCYFDALRFEAAVRLDFEWWKTGATPRSAAFAGNLAPGHLETFRAGLLNRLLGTNWQETITLPPAYGAFHSALVGPVLGTMPLDRYSAAAEVCRRSSEKLDGYRMGRFGEGQQPDPAEEARLRHETRRELGRLLTPEELEEFLLRNSHNAETLRQGLAGFNATPEEFRKIFRALDPLQHQLQLDYGSAAALSAKQAEEFERQCERAVQEVLPPERYLAYQKIRAAALPAGPPRPSPTPSASK